MRLKSWLASLLALTSPGATASSPAAEPGIRQVDKDTLKAMLGDPQLLIIDVRSPGSWAQSASKIPGAIRRDPHQVAAWGPALPRDKKIALY